MSVKIIVDSASDVTVAYAEKHGIGFAPLKTMLNGHEYRDGIDIIPDVFYDKLVANKELAHTKRNRFAYFCTQFVAEVLEYSGAAKLRKKSTRCFSDDLKSLPGMKLSFQGNMKAMIKRFGIVPSLA